MSTPLLEVRDLAVTATAGPGGAAAPILRGVSFELGAGEIVGLLGVSGSGKTTLLDVVRGAGAPDPGGSVRVAGRDPRRDAASRARIGHVPQHDPLHRALSVEEACRFAARLRLPDQAAAVHRERVDAAIAAVDLGRRRHYLIGSEEHPGERVLSGGERKRASLAVELVADAALLLLDEPLSGLSPPDARKIVDVLRTQAAQGRAILLVAHEASPFFFDAVDRLLVLAPGGRQLAFATPARVFEQLEQQWLASQPDLAPRSHRVGAMSPAERFWTLYGELATAAAAEAATRDALRSSAAPGPAPAAAAAPLAEPRPSKRAALARWLRAARAQLAPLLERQALLTLREPSLGRSLLQTPVALGVLGAVVMSGEPRALLGYATFVAFLLGALPASTAISGEWAVYYREQAAGLHHGAYVVAKLAVLAGWGIVRCAALALAVLLVASLPPVATTIQLDPLALLAALAAALLAGSSIGLLTSAVLRAERAVSFALVFVVGVVLVLSGILVPPSARMNQDLGLFELNPLRWAYGAAVVANRTDDLAALGLGRDSFALDLLLAALLALLPLGLAPAALRLRLHLSGGPR